METAIHIEPATQGMSQSLFLSSSEKAKQKPDAVVGLNDALFQAPGMYQFANQTLDYAFNIVGGQAGSLLLASPENKHFLNSSSKCNSFSNKWNEVMVEQLVGSLISPGFFRAIIEERDRLIHLLPGDLSEIRLLGKELS